MTEKAKDIKNKLTKNQTARESALEKPATKRSMKDWIEIQSPAFFRALPKHIDPERFIRVAMTAMRATPKLGDCDPQSVLGALMLSAQLGLEPNTPLGHAYLIPYRNNRTQKMECQFQVGYKGMIDLFYRADGAYQVFANYVCEKDEFEYEYGSNAQIKHISSTAKDKGKVTHVYAYARFRDAFTFVVLTREEALEAKKSSQGANSSYSPWNKFEKEMLMKTALKRLARFLPQSIEIAKAATTDNALIGGMKFDENDDDGVVDVSYEEIDNNQNDNTPSQDTPPPDLLQEMGN